MVSMQQKPYIRGNIITEYKDIAWIAVNLKGTGITVKIVETYLLDFNEMIYGEQLQTFFYKFLRSEQKFPSVEELQR